MMTAGAREKCRLSVPRARSNGRPLGKTTCHLLCYHGLLCSATQAIVIPSDSEDEDGLESMETLIGVGGRPDPRGDANRASRFDRSASVSFKVSLNLMQQSISMAFPGIDSDDEVEGRAAALVQASGSAKRRKLNDGDTVAPTVSAPVWRQFPASRSLPKPKTHRDKEQRASQKQQEKQDKQLAKAAAKVGYHTSAAAHFQAAKEAEKSFQKKVTEVNRVSRHHGSLTNGSDSQLRTSKNETVREIHLYMSADMALPDSPIAGALPEIRARFTESLSEIHFLADDDSPIPGTIRIKRHVKARWDTELKRFAPLAKPYWEWDKTVLIVIDAEEVVDKMLHGQDMLLDWIRDTRLLLGLDESAQIVVIVKGLGRYQAKTKTLANREFTAMARAGLTTIGSASSASAAPATRLEKDLIERDLIELQVQEGVFIVHGASDLLFPTGG